MTILFSTAYQMSKVGYDITNEKTLKREITALTEASSELKCNTLLFINWDSDEIITHKGSEIHLIPAWKWLTIKG